MATSGSCPVQQREAWTLGLGSEEEPTGPDPRPKFGARLWQFWRGLVIWVTLSTYIALGPFGYAAFTLFSLVPVGSRSFRARLLQGIMRNAFAGMHHWVRWLRVIDFDPRSVQPLIPPGPFVLIANHPTLTDTTAILGAVPAICTAVRSDVFATPWLRPLLSTARYFSAGGKGPFSTAGLVEAATERLQEGYRVLMFPEGTRSQRGQLGRFGRTAFEVACRAHVPVLALAISERPAWLAPGDRIWVPPARLPTKRLSLLGVFHPDDFASDSRAMRTFVEQKYVELQQRTATYREQTEPRPTSAPSNNAERASVQN